MWDFIRVVNSNMWLPDMYNEPPHAQFIKPDGKRHLYAKD